VGINRGATNLDNDLTNSISEKDLLEFIRKKGLLNELINEKQDFEDLIPLSIFKNDLGSYESICKYLKEQGLKNKEIANLTGRDSKSVWQAINKANKKHPKQFTISHSPYDLPKDILQKTQLPVLECIVSHLIENYHLNYAQIGELLNRDQRTIWTIHNRKKK